MFKFALIIYFICIKSNVSSTDALQQLSRYLVDTSVLSNTFNDFNLWYLIDSTIQEQC